MGLLSVVVEARRKHAVSYTATVMSTHRFHVIQSNAKNTVTGLQSFVKKSKVYNICTHSLGIVCIPHSYHSFISQVRAKRGKYRAATTTVGQNQDEVTLVELLWNDSSLMGCVSADLGSEQLTTERRMGRWKVPIVCPKMMIIR